jgi:hypothetical protein
MKLLGDKTLEVTYKRIKNKLGNLLRTAEKNYYKYVMDKNKNDLSKLWSILNTVINRKIKNDIKFKHNNMEISNDLEIANLFNKHYLNIVDKLCDQIPKPTKDSFSNMKGSFPNSLFLSPTNENEILEIISNLKKSSPGHDDIDTNIIKHPKHEILTPLVHICNLLFS